MMSGTHRLFFALPLPADLKRVILTCFREKNFHGIRFTPDENLHITLHFLGNTDTAEINKIKDVAGQICDSVSPFEMTLENLKTIEKNRKPVMIWAQFEADTGFEYLAQQFRKFFPTGEMRIPNPHATVARIRQLKLLPFDLPSIRKSPIKVMDVELWESTTHPEGAKYSVIQKWNLKH